MATPIDESHDATQADFRSALLRIETFFLRLEAVHAALVVELRRARGEKDWVDHELLSAIWNSWGDRAWCVADLYGPELITRQQGKQLGRALGALADMGGRSGSMRLLRIEGRKNAGNRWRIVPATEPAACATWCSGLGAE